MKINFKNVLACLCVASAMNSFSQQYFKTTIGAGLSSIQYSSEKISSEFFAPSSLGGGLAAEYIALFTPYSGVSIGAGLSMWQSQFELNDVLYEEMPYYVYGDKTERSFIYSAKFQDWKEKQRIFTIDVPIGLVGKATFSKDVFAMIGAGVKIQFPIKAQYVVFEDGIRQTSGYYNDFDLSLLPEKGIDQYGFYTLDHNSAEWDDISLGDLNTVPIGFAAYLDLGLTQNIGFQRFYYGIYAQYGIKQINEETTNRFLNQYGRYDSPFNTTTLDFSRLVSVGLKIGYVLPLTGEEKSSKLKDESLELKDESLEVKE